MTAYDASIDEYEAYEQQFDPMLTDRQARRRRKPKARHIAKKSRSRIIAELADDTTDTIGAEGGFETTYRPARYEEGWLLSSLRSFYEQDLISDVLAQVKGGKEANVYRCQAHPSTGMDLLAAKVYRPRMFRNLRNDKMYREGRSILTVSGNPVKDNEHRIMRAIGKKTAFGVQVQHTSWLMYEVTALQRLHEAGAAVPQIIAANENAILMSYHGDAGMAAPTLNQVSLEPEEAVPLLKEVLRNIELMLQHGLIHGDLSAYNILHWEGKITLIDFPQVTDVLTNTNATFILQRDIKRICEYFARQGVQSDPDGFMADLWDRCVGIEPSDLLPPELLPSDDDGE